MFEAFSEMKFFSVYGLIAVLIIVIPNFIFAKKGQNDRPDDIANAGTANSFVEFLSRLALNIVLVAMRFPLSFRGFAAGACIVLILYYLAWVKFFAGGRHYPDIYLKSFMGIPLPFDVLNAAYFLLVSLWLNNLIALILSLAYAVSRIRSAIAARNDLKLR